MGPTVRAMKKIKKMLGVVLVAAGIASGLGTYLLNQHYGRSDPSDAA
jgi:hypothetical protein